MRGAAHLDEGLRLGAAGTLVAEVRDDPLQVRRAPSEEALHVVLVAGQGGEEACGERTLLARRAPGADDALDQLGNVGAQEAREHAHRERLGLRAALAGSNAAHDRREPRRSARGEERVAAGVGARDALQDAEEVRKVGVISAAGGGAACRTPRAPPRGSDRHGDCCLDPAGREADALARRLPARRHAQVSRRSHEEARDGGGDGERLEAGLGAAQAVQRDGRGGENAREACEERGAGLASTLGWSGWLCSGEVEELLGSSRRTERRGVCARHLLQEVHRGSDAQQRLRASGSSKLASPPVAAHSLQDLRCHGAFKERRHRPRDGCQ